MTPGDPQATRVMRVIARLNVGGPAHHVSILAAGLDPQRYRTLLLAGRLGPGEGSFEHLAARSGVDARRVPALRPELSAASDARAVGALVRAMVRFRPQIVHTHTAKAGLVGRLAAHLAPIPTPIVVHTYHGHVLRGYFSERVSSALLVAERRLATWSDVLVGVSEATVAELVELGVAPRDRFRVIPLGLELDRFAAVGPADRAGARAALGVPADARVVSYAGRFAPIKRLDVLVGAVALAARSEPRLVALLAGDGETRGEAERLARDLGVSAHFRFLGFRDDLPLIAAASDAAVLCSDNEGTPVALIEAAAAGLPSVATDVGGVADIVAPGTGNLVAAGDVPALAFAMLDITADLERSRAMGRQARRHVLTRFAAPRLVDDVDALYRDALAVRGARADRGPST